MHRSVKEFLRLHREGKTPAEIAASVDFEITVETVNSFLMATQGKRRKSKG
jgi:hypothetical protein